MAADPNMTIMTVDDFSTMRRIIRTLLRQIGFNNVLEAEDGTGALEILKSQKVDFVISDWNMPKMTGLELLQAVRSDEKLKKTPFLMVTAEAEKDKILAAIKAGVSHYIVKPFTADVLKQKIDAIFNQ